MFQVYQSSCENCLFSKNRIVSPERAKEIISTCLKEQTHFICHKSSMEGGEICCHSFYKKLGKRVGKIKVFEHLGIITFSNQPKNKSDKE